MNDKELLELAAKAMGYKYMNGALWDGRDVVEYEWHPQDDAAQAMRIAVKLQMEICTYDHASSSASICFKNGEFYKSFDAFEKHESSDPCQATCRAIVRAAAEAGKAST